MNIAALLSIISVTILHSIFILSVSAFLYYVNDLASNLNAFPVGFVDFTFVTENVSNDAVPVINHSQLCYFLWTPYWIYILNCR